MNTDLKRIRTLMRLRQRSANQAQAEAAEARRRAEAAEREAQEASDSWRAKAAELSQPSTMSAADYASAHAHLQALDASAERARGEHARQLAEADQRREAAIAAEREREKVERWSDRVIARKRAESDRAERLAEDEIAARQRRRTHDQSAES